MQIGKRYLVKAGDYSYEGVLVSVFPKLSGKLRVVVEDDNGRLFIHNMNQIFKIEKDTWSYEAEELQIDHKALAQQQEERAQRDLSISRGRWVTPRLK